MYDPDLHLFVDNAEIHQIINLRRFLNKPARHPEPVLMADEPWERGYTAVAWGSVIQEAEDHFRMWYMLGGTRKPSEQGCAIAESKDGLHWTKPKLGLVEWEGSKDNNVFFRFPPDLPVGNICAMDGYTVVRDDDAPAGERYKLIAFMHDYRMWARSHPDQHDRHITDEEIELARSVTGLHIWSSSDGINFSGKPEFLQRTYGDYLKVVRDYRNGRWMLNTRIPQFVDVEAGHRYRRNVGVATSTDLRHWSLIESVILNEADNAFGRLWEWHGLTPFNYGDMDLGFLDIQDSVFPTGTCELVSHRDGMPWQRVMPGEYFMDRGPEGSLDRHGGAPTHNEPIQVGDKLLIYYNTGQKGDVKPGVRGRLIAAGIISLDRFVGLSHGHTKTGEPYGFVVTKPVVVEGEELQVNVEEYGEGVRVAVVNADASEIPGYSLSDCLTITGNVLRQPVRWREKRDLAELKGRTVMLVFAVDQAVIYSYRLKQRKAERAGTG